MRIFLIIVGVVMALFGVACGASGIAAYRAVDSDGYVSAGGRMVTTAAAFISDTAEFEDIDEEDEPSRIGKVRIRIQAERADGGDVFVGIGPAELVEQIVASGSHELVRGFEWEPFDYVGVVRGTGDLAPLQEGERDRFAAWASGPGEQEVIWPTAEGSWRALIMNADGAAGVDVEASFGARFPYLRQFAIVAMVVGGLLLAGGVLLVVFQARRRRRPAAEGG